MSLQGTPPKAKGAVRILRFAVEVECEVMLDEGDGNTILGVKSHSYSIGSKPKYHHTKKDLMDIAANKKALAELACFTVIEKHEQDRQAIAEGKQVLIASKDGKPVPTDDE